MHCGCSIIGACADWSTNNKRMEERLQPRLMLTQQAQGNILRLQEGGPDIAHPWHTNVLSSVPAQDLSADNKRMEERLQQRLMRTQQAKGNILRLQGDSTDMDAEGGVAVKDAVGASAVVDADAGSNCLEPGEDPSWVSSRRSDESGSDSAGAERPMNAARALQLVKLTLKVSRSV